MTDIKVESDEVIINRLNERFEALTSLTKATAHGMNRSLIAVGCPGVGKSYGVEKILDNLPSRLSYVSVSGNMKATGLYKILFENRAKGCTILIDDCDSIFSDSVALNILKKATDTSIIRKISWNTETKMETTDGEALPRSFEFEGSVIILTNLDLDSMSKSGSNSEHIDALISRAHYINLGLTSLRSKFLRVKQVVKAGMLQEQGVDYQSEEDILFFMESNIDNLREISLRTAIKIASLVRISSTNWKSLAKTTILK